MSYSQKVDQGYLSLARGLVTESSKLAAVEGATSDELNMVLDTNGMIRRRRKGLSLISEVVATEDFVGQLDNAYYWDLHDVFVTVTTSTQLDSEEEPTGLLNVRLTFVDAHDPSSVLQDYTVPVEEKDYSTPQFSEIRDRLVVALGSEPVVVSINEEQEVSVFRVRTYIRDFQLLDDDLSIAERPESLTDLHKYNLYNAGWWQERKKEGGTLVAPEVEFESVRSEYPSNADVAYLGDKVDNDGELVFDPETFDNINVGNTEAPRGHYVFLSRRINRNTKLTNKDDDGTPSRTLVAVIVDGELPGGGTPPGPSDPVGPSPTEPCLPGEICTIEP